jgi:hypothetical protein
MSKLSLCVALILLLCLAAAAVAQESTLVISDADKTPVIKVDLSTSLTSFSKTITITLSGLKAGEMRPLSARERTSRIPAGSRSLIKAMS